MVRDPLKGNKRTKHTNTDPLKPQKILQSQAALELLGLNSLYIELKTGATTFGLNSAGGTITKLFVF